VRHAIVVGNDVAEMRQGDFQFLLAVGQKRLGVLDCFFHGLFFIFWIVLWSQKGDPNPPERWALQ